MAKSKGLLKRFFGGDDGYEDSYLYDAAGYENFTDISLDISHRESLHGRHLIQSVDNAIQTTALTASRCNVRITGDLSDVWKKIVQPGRFMTLLVTDLLRHGNAVYLIDEMGLQRVSNYQVLGKRSIRYKIERAMPDGSTSRTVPAAGVAHIKINEDRSDPWRGRSPFEGAYLLALVERGFRDFAKIRNKRIVSAPTPAVNMEGKGQSHQDSNMLELIFSRAGTEIFSMKTNRGSMDAIKSTNLIFEPSKEAIELRDRLVDEVYSAVGIPPTLRGDAVPGMAYKTALSAWIDGFLQPLGNTIAEQLSDALECTVEIDMTPAKVALVADQAKIVADLVKAGVEIAEARKIAGL